MKRITDSSIEQNMSMLLRAGVLLSALMVISGLIMHVIQHGSDAIDHRHFHGEPATLSYPLQILITAFHGNALAIVQTGVMLLVITPIARVVFAIVAFFKEGDYLYFMISALVLAIIVLSYVLKVGA